YLLYTYVNIFFFFSSRRRHTRFSRDWSSDVCSSDLDLNEVKEPILACPNDPDDVKVLSEVAGDKIDEVFIGSCMTNIGHFRAAGKLLDATKDELSTRLWIAPPTKMDEHQLMEEGDRKSVV